VSQEVWLIRHGATEWSVSGQHTGTTDLPLLPDGEQTARGLAQRLAGVEFVRVLTSPLQRARQTAELAGFGDHLEVVDDLREWDYGDYEGRTTEDIREQRPGWVLWTDGAPAGEVAAEVATRVDRVIADVRRADGNVAIFAHGHLLRVFGARWCDWPPEEGRRLALGTAAVSVLGYERETAVLIHWNDGPP
jgi:broad specificity phosphatase PhoE